MSLGGVAVQRFAFVSYPGFFEGKGKGFGGLGV